MATSRGVAAEPRPEPASGDRQWYIVGRWQEFEGEGCTNLIRIAGIAAFYIVELINYYGLKLGPLSMPRISDCSSSRRTPSRFPARK